MRLAHIAIATPGRCGLYETTRELVAGERALGADARIVDPKPIPSLSPGHQDRGVPLEGMDWAVTADVIVSHSGHDGTSVAETDQPIIHVAHGRPLSTFLGERDGNAPAYTYNAVRSRQDRYRCAVTFWSEYEPYLRLLWSPKPVRIIPPPVDLSYWKPGGTEYDFAGQKGGYNVVMTDPWCRTDVSPFHTINAFALFRSMVPEARLHLFAMNDNPKGLSALKMVLGDSLGLIQTWAKDLRVVYRAADMLITPHRIYTRSIREAMACGVPVVSGRDEHPEDIEGFAMAMFRRMEQPYPARKVAEGLFDPLRTADAFLKVARSCVRQEVAVGD